MQEISLCMIVRDEEDVIGRCLESIKDIVDEIIIVDTGSIDRTKEIVSKYTDKIFDFEWVDDFAKARNFSFSKATKDYIMWLDADDVIEVEDREKLMLLKKNIDTNVDIYRMPYKIDESTSFHRERLMKREKNYQWVSPIHEVIVPIGNVKDVDINITHRKEKVKDSNRNIRIFEHMIQKGIVLDNRQEYCYAKELYYLGRYREAIGRYESFIEKYKKEYLQTRDYLYTSMIELADCYKRLQEEEKQLKTLFRIMEYEIPTAECCCKIGDVFLERKEYKIATYWYELAIEKSNALKSGDNGNFDYNEFYPCICLGVCYYWQGDKEKAYSYNERGGKLKPQDKTYLYNKSIFS